MANTSISNLSAGAAVSATDLLPNVQAPGAGPVKTTAAQLKTFMSSSPTLVTPNIGVATGTSLALTGAVTQANGYSTPYSLVNTAIPFVFTSGSMGNNGALTLTTAVRAAYPDAYIYLPAGAIAIGSTAGWYYAVFSTTGAATVYNNVYTSGVPAIPASPTAFVTTGPGAFTFSTGSSYFGHAVTLAANSLGINGGLRFNYVTWANNSANAKYVSVFVSTGVSLTGAAGYTSQGAARWDVVFANKGATNKQVFSVTEWSSSQLYSQTGSSTLDMTTSQIVYSNFYLNVSTSDVLVIESLQVIVTP